MHIFARRLPSLSIPSGGATNRFRQCRRTFLNLPGNPFASLAGAASPEPLRYHEEKPLLFSQRQLYSLIADVDSYSEFVPYCTSSSVRSARSLPDGARLSLRDRSWLVGGKEGEEYQLEGELKVGFQGLDQAYTSKVTCKKWESVKAISDDSTVFKLLSTKWSLSPLQPIDGNPQTLVSLLIDYQFATALHQAAATAFSNKISQKMMAAFEMRCRSIYGRGGQR